MKLVPPDSHRAGPILDRYGAALIFERGDFQQAIEALGHALEIAQRENDPTLEVTVLTSMAGTHWLALHPREALKYSLRAIELDRVIDKTHPDAGRHFWAALAQTDLGDLEGASTHANTFLAIMEKYGSRNNIGQALHINQAIALLKGDWATARELSDRGLAVDHWDTRILSNRAMLEYELGDISEGHAYLDSLIETMRLSSSGPTLPISTVAIGLASRLTGKARQFDIADAAGATVLSSPFAFPIMAHITRTGLALIAVERDDVEAAREQYDHLKFSGVSMSQLSPICGHRVLGILAETMGRNDDADAHFEDSLAFCRKAGARPELAWTNYDYANALLQRGVSADNIRAASMLEEAAAISTELGMRPLIERVIALQERAKKMAMPTPAYPDGLTEREVEVLRLLAAGRTNQQIADDLIIAPSTAAKHVANILDKTGSSNRAEAATYANQQHLVEA